MLQNVNSSPNVAASLSTLVRASMRRLRIAAPLVALWLVVPQKQAEAQLVASSFLVAGDGLIIKDLATHLDWLTPSYTKGQVFNSASVQGINGTYGFRYATAAEVVSMINTNFGSPTTASPGNAAGFASASAFFALFGINEQINCFDANVSVACPRTQGFTSTAGTPGNRLAFGMIQFGTNGSFITNNDWFELSTEIQTGSWLVRSTDTVVTPEPSAVLLVGAGLVGVGMLRRRRSVGTALRG
jgi:hypothetical protein